MSRNYDNWERLVAAVIKKQQLLELFHAHSRSPSVLSDASDFSSSFSFNDVSFGYSIPGGSSPYIPQQAQVNKSKNSALVFISDYEPIFEHGDLLRASSEILGKGTFTTVRAYELNYGTTIVVKRLNMVNISEKGFKKHMRIVGDVKHENVAGLMAYYYSKDEKLMICDHYGSGSVSALLHGNPRENRPKLDWEVRLRIALGAAKGISHIHAQNRGKMVHGNIKASNIFLNSEGYGVVSDLGLASMARTTFSQSSSCYAPEVKSTRNVSQASDVYSFGIFLLELLTRKSPDLSLGHESMDLVQLVNHVSHQEWYMTVFDEELLMTPSIGPHIVAMLILGSRCMAKSPKKRPKMSEVVKMIDDIGKVDLGNPVYKQMIEDLFPVDKGKTVHKQMTEDLGLVDEGNLVYKQTESEKLVILGDGNATFYREDLSGPSVKVLGNGTFGTSYKVILENGIIVCVKILKDVIVTNEEFQQHLEITGRLEHENVAELKAHYYSTDEKLLVYDYFNHGSLSAILHGTINSDRRPLDWSTRLKIAISAAKGIAHIHTKNGQNLVHGNIRASNILLDEKQYGIVSDVGLVKLVSPLESFVTNNAGYGAPEVIDNTKLSQASDVYAFGIVLLELLSGESPEMIFQRELMSFLTWFESFVIDGLATLVFDAEVWGSGKVDMEMVEMRKIAMYCVSFLPETRPKMAEVARMLEDIQRTERNQITLNQVRIQRSEHG